MVETAAELANAPPLLFIAGMFEALHFADLYYFYVAIPLLLGLFLTFEGYKASPR
ncbi:MAG TPA: hypothetical protein VN802_16400 [Stellaceae bacterium]|nr:hypothetical protein [Stellaceae bacterium]